MDTARLESLLQRVASGETTVNAALENLRGFPYDDTLGYARLDTQRAVRTGSPEVVFCQGKSVEQCVGIARRLSETADVILMTRAEPEVGSAIQSEIANATYYAAARCLILGTPPIPPPEAGYVAVVSAGTADTPVVEEAVVTLTALGTPVRTAFDVGVAGLHRVLDQRPLLDGAVCVIVVAGMEGALASVVGGLVSCPVVACPTSVGYGASFGGVAALLTMLNSCASGVAVVNIDNGFGAAYFAHLIAKNAKEKGRPLV
jgi:pyridinium-3,5-biscarboxylic acid mononucleotide synthase